MNDNARKKKISLFAKPLVLSSSPIDNYSLQSVNNHELSSSLRKPPTGQEPKILAYETQMQVADGETFDVDDLFNSRQGIIDLTRSSSNEQPESPRSPPMLKSPMRVECPICGKLLLNIIVEQHAASCIASPTTADRMKKRKRPTTMLEYLNRNPPSSAQKYMSPLIKITQIPDSLIQPKLNIFAPRRTKIIPPASPVPPSNAKGYDTSFLSSPPVQTEIIEPVPEVMDDSFDDIHYSSDSDTQKSPEMMLSHLAKSRHKNVTDLTTGSSSSIGFISALRVTETQNEAVKERAFESHANRPSTKYDFGFDMDSGIRKKPLMSRNVLPLIKKPRTPKAKPKTDVYEPGQNLFESDEELSPLKGFVNLKDIGFDNVHTQSINGYLQQFQPPTESAASRSNEDALEPSQKRKKYSQGRGGYGKKKFTRKYSRR